MRVLYIRTDIMDEELTCGGSVAHTLGVLEGFVQNGIEVICASSCMQPLLGKFKPIQLLNPKFLKPLRWKLNCFFSTFFFAWKITKCTNIKTVDFIYQRYSLLNATGLFLAWWYKKKLVLEYNGSEAWIVKNWSTEKRWFQLSWLCNKIESINIKYADSIVVVSDPLKDELISKAVIAKKILVNPNGVQT